MARKTNPDKCEGESIKRRDALKALGSSTIALATLSTTIAGASQKTKEVPELLSAGEVVKYMEVPVDWHQHVKHAREAKKKLTEQIGDLPNVFSTALVGQKEEFGGKRGLQIRVQVKDRLRATNIPDRVDDIPVLTEPAPQSHGPAGCYNNEQESHAAGGELVGWANGGYGTCTGAVWSSSTEKQLLHCAHVFWDDCNDAKYGDIVGRKVARMGTEIGEVVEYDRKGDYVLIDNQGYNSTFERHIEESDYSRPDLIGWVSRSKIDSMASSSTGDDVNKVGATHGLNSGEIVASSKSFTFDCFNFHDEGVEATTDFANGDSGGPVYIMRNGDAYITHVASYRYYDRGTVTTCSGSSASVGNAVGQAAYYIDNNENVTFGTKY